MSKVQSVSNKQINKDIIISIIPLIIILIIEISFSICNMGIRGLLYISTNAIMFSVLIAYLIYGILFGITKKTSIATIIFSIMCALLFIINQIKITYTGDPIYFSDINFISNVDKIFNMISGNIFELISKYMIVFVILGILSFFIIKWNRKNDISINNIKTRIIIIIICILILLILFVPNKYTKNIFLNIFLNIDEYQDYASYTNNLTYYIKNSLFGGMYGVLLNNRFDEPAEYNEDELNRILETTATEGIENSWGTPNIILMFSESFWDIDKQDDVKFNEDIASNIKRLKEKGKVVETLTCTYGGMSENVAFELLTGGSLKYFTKGYIPIMSLYSRNGSENIPSIVKELKNNNYRSKIIFGKDYYSSEKSMKKIGFDEYIELEETENNKKGIYISDDYITDVIIEELKKKEKGEKLFYMAETIQNHMPFKKDKYEKYDISIKNSIFKSEINDTILFYAQGIYDADKQLGRLYEYIKEYEEPTILIFLGDHLPYLYTEERENALKYLSYFNTGNKNEDIYRMYNTQALIVSNYNIDTKELPKYMSNNLVLTYIVNNMDIELSTYYKWLYSTMKDLPASNSEISLDINGQKYKTDELPKNMYKTNKLREYMQYKFFIKPVK